MTVGWDCAALRRVLGMLLLALAALVFAPDTALAQSTPPPVPAPPVRSTVDANGVDLISGQLLVSRTDVAIGPDGNRGLRLSRQWVENGWRINEIPTINGNSMDPLVTVGGRSYQFVTNPSGGYKSQFEDGSTLSSDRTKFTTAEGTEVTFTMSYMNFLNSMESTLGRPTQVKFTDGVVWTYHYTTGSHYVPPSTPPTPPDVDYPQCAGGGPPECWILWEQYNRAYAEWQASWGTFYSMRLASLTSSSGYQIKLFYASDTLASPGDWHKLIGTRAINNAVEYCSPTASCSTTNPWAGSTYSDTTWTSPSNVDTTYTYSGGKLAAIRAPGRSTDSVMFYYSGDRVSSVTVDGAGTWNYAYGSGTTTVTDPLSKTRTIVYNGDGGVTSDTNELGQTTQIVYCGPSEANCPEGLPKTVIAPEGNSVTYAYDARGNVTNTTYASKGGLLPSITTSATYPAGACANPLTCNKPTSTTDARGQVTDYTYDAGHGGLTSVTAPADASGVRPQTRLSYSTASATYYTAPSTLTTGPTMVVPTGSSTCRVASSGNPASCVGTADEQVATIVYPSSGANNAQPVSMTSKAGNNTLVATTAVSYDIYGWVNSVDGPLSGTADKAIWGTRPDGRRDWEIGADPDDGGSALFPAKRYQYSWTTGLLDRVEAGTATAQSYGGIISGFSELTETVLTYDDYNRLIEEALLSGGTLYQETDTVYDGYGRVACTVVRMESVYGWNVCVPNQPPATNGTYGPDRVTSNTYDALGRVSKVTTAAGTTVASEVTSTFTPNGRLATLTDQEGNKTTYTYDAHDRLSVTSFPHLSIDGQSSNTDYEELGYDANGNVTSFRGRNGWSLTMAYDNLNRLITKYVPDPSGLPSWSTRDVYFGYDLFGGLTYARFDSASGEGITNAFNALGQITSTTTNMDSVSRTLNYGYTVNGSLTRLTYPDGNHADYYYTGAGAFYVSYLNAASPLFYPPLDSAGRVTALYRWNTTGSSWSAPTAFSYDAVSRPASASHDMAGSTYDIQSSFAYNRASQFTSVSRNNDAYAFTGHVNTSRSYTANGLNQYGAVGGTSFTYDQAGNLISDGVTSFAYDVENRMIMRDSGAATLRYDPLGRLYEVYGSSTGTTRFLYSGNDLLAEYDTSGNLLRRYVHGGGGGDDPLVWFEGSGVADGARRYLYGDERGSIVAVTDNAGNVSYINSYDEYGIPNSAGNDISTRGRFRYTGQAWIPELGMYYYKARMYSPTLGRFMQTDPIGYGDGMNMYAYVGSDPVNGVDPTGLAEPLPGEDETACTQRYITGGNFGPTADGFCRPAIVVSANRGDPMERLCDLFLGMGVGGNECGGANPMEPHQGPSAEGGVPAAGAAGEAATDIRVTARRRYNISRISRPLVPADLGPQIGGFILVEGDIKERNGLLDITVTGVLAEPPRGVIRQGLGTSVRIARELGLRGVLISAWILNPKLATLVDSGSLTRSYPGAEVYPMSAGWVRIFIPTP